MKFKVFKLCFNYNSTAILSNKNTGELLQRGISLNVQSNRIKSMTPFFQIDWISDTYDINLKTISLSLLGGIPDFTDDQDLNLIRKDAFNIFIGVEIVKNNWGMFHYQ